jgi:hypothetical protein
MRRFFFLVQLPSFCRCLDPFKTRQFSVPSLWYAAKLTSKF